MTDEAFKDGIKVKDLETEIKKTLDEFKDSSTSNFGRDSMMTIVTKNYKEYLRLSVEYKIPIKELMSVTETYLEILGEYVKHEEANV